MDRTRMNTTTLDRVSRLASTAGDAASIQISLDAIEWDITLVDKDVRKLVEVTQSKTSKTYAGTSNATEQGRAFLKKQLDVLMKEKAQYKEKKQALLQLQGELPRIEKEKAAAQDAPPAALSGSPSEAQDQKDVAATTLVWKETVTSGTYDAPKKTAALYAEDGVLWGTVSEEVRDTPEQIYAYFDYFARLPELRVVEYTPVAVRVYGDFAIQAGTYTFAFQGPDGSTVEKRARFSFTFRRDRPGSPQPWTIVEHHSSSMPTAPAGLKRVGPNADIVKVTPKKVEITPDQKAVAATTIVWKDTVTLGTDDAPRKTADLYAEDAVLWGTVSEEVRETPEQIYDYFDFFARLPKLRVVEYTPAPVRVYGQFAVEAGTYTFAWQGDDGATVKKRARFSFTFRRGKPGSAQPWTIVEHHSSSMPIAPAELKRVEIDAEVESLAGDGDGDVDLPEEPVPEPPAAKGVTSIFRALFGGGGSRDDGSSSRKEATLPATTPGDAAPPAVPAAAEASAEASAEAAAEAEASTSKDEAVTETEDPATEDSSEDIPVDTHPIEVKAKIGARGLGLILGKEKDGTRWSVKGFSVFPDGEPNPAVVAGIEEGDTLHMLDGVKLGSYKEGMELFKSKRGLVAITVLRQGAIAI